MNNTHNNVANTQEDLYKILLFHKSIITPQSGFMINAPAKSASSHLKFSLIRVNVTTQ